MINALSVETGPGSVLSPSGPIDLSLSRTHFFFFNFRGIRLTAAWIGWLGVMGERMISSVDGDYE